MRNVREGLSPLRGARMRSTIFAAILAPLVLWTSAAEAAGSYSNSLKPSSEWQLERTEERCSTTRNFATARGDLRLQIHSFGSQTEFWVRVPGMSVPRPANHPGKFVTALRRMQGCVIEYRQFKDLPVTGSPLLHSPFSSHPTHHQVLKIIPRRKLLRRADA